MQFSPEFPVNLGGRKVSWYFAEVGQKRFRRIDRSKTRQPSPGLVHGKTRFRVPRGRYRFYIYWCFEITDIGPDTGMGKPPTDDKCPKSFRIRRKGRAKAAVARLAGQVAAGSPIPENL